MNEIYNRSDISEDPNRSIFIALPKTPGTNECELHRINLISKIKKHILRILMNRPSRIGPEIGQEQSGFFKDNGTQKVRFILRIISKRGNINAEDPVPVFYRLCKGV